MKRGEFREDLYYRLNVFPIYSTPLREIKEDILLLAEHFKAILQRKHGVNLTGFSSAANSSLLSHDWPGNIRELQNTIERAVILTESGNYIEPSNLGLISPDGPELHLQELASHPNFAHPKIAFIEGEGSGKPDPESLISIEELEKRYILHALETTGGNRSLAARHLKVTSRTLRNKLKQYQELERL